MEVGELSTEKAEIVKKIKEINMSTPEGNTVKREVFSRGAERERNFLGQFPENSDKRLVEISEMLGMEIAKNPDKIFEQKAEMSF